MQPHPLAEHIAPQLARWRQALHRMPEISGQEYNTQEYIIRQLKSLNPDQLHEIGDTGVRCVFLCGIDPARTLAFRADMDALPIQEETGLPFASEKPGVMHACGHDGHMAALLGLAACCATLKTASLLPANVVLLFQPAEETVGGAKRLIAQGALENPRVDEIFGLHMMPEHPLGFYAACAGPMMSAVYEFDIQLRGKSAHGAMPQLGINALDAAGALYARLKALPQKCPPGEMMLLNIGKFHGGDAHNIVPAFAEMEGMARVFKDGLLLSLKEDISRAMRGVATAHDTVALRKDKVYYPPVVNDADLVKALEDALRGEMIVQNPVMIAEDFSIYQQHRPGLFTFVGTRGEGHDEPLHSSRFTYDDRALVYALNLHLTLLFARSEKKG